MAKNKKEAINVLWKLVAHVEKPSEKPEAFLRRFADEIRDGKVKIDEVMVIGRVWHERPVFGVGIADNIPGDGTVERLGLIEWAKQILFTRGEKIAADYASREKDTA